MDLKAKLLVHLKALKVTNHKLDGIDGNKKPTEFSEEEKYTLKGALIDLADRIRRAADTID